MQKSYKNNGTPGCKETSCFNHCIYYSILKHSKHEICLVAQHENKLPSALSDSKTLKTFGLPFKYKQWLSYLPNLFNFILRFIFDFWIVLYFFLRHKSLRNSKIVLIQNPPSISVMLAFLCMKIIRVNPAVKLWVDFHNFGCFLLRTRSRVVFKIYKYLEIFLIRFLAHRVFTVSKKMKTVLKKKWKYSAPVHILYDAILEEEFEVSLLAFINSMKFTIFFIFI